MRERKLRHAYGNAGKMVCFKVGVEDAEILERADKFRQISNLFSFRGFPIINVRHNMHSRVLYEAYRTLKHLKSPIQRCLRLISS